MKLRVNFIGSLASSTYYDYYFIKKKYQLNLVKGFEIKIFIIILTKEHDIFLLGSVESKDGSHYNNSFEKINIAF